MLMDCRDVDNYICCVFVCRWWWWRRCLMLFRHVNVFPVSGIIIFNNIHILMEKVTSPWFLRLSCNIQHLGIFFFGEILSLFSSCCKQSEAISKLKQSDSLKIEIRNQMNSVDFVLITNLAFRATLQYFARDFQFFVKEKKLFDKIPQRLEKRKGFISTQYNLRLSVIHAVLLWTS